MHPFFPHQPKPIRTPRPATALAAIGPNRAPTTPAPSEWSAAEILCHLTNRELAFAFRLRQTLAEDAPTLQPFDQDSWTAPYSGIAAEQALEMFLALRGWNLRLIGTAMPASADRPLTPSAAP